jgi:hypothetical protein
MDMKNVKNANFLQVNHRVEKIFGGKGTVILESKEAWEKFPWTRSYFEKKPKEGYFIWVKSQPKFPLSTCVILASKKIDQNLKNLLVIEKGIKTKAVVFCAAERKLLCGKHTAKGKVILKKEASLEYNHFHKWGEKDVVLPDYEFYLGKESKLIYSYQNLFPPKNLKIKTKIFCSEGSSLNLKFIIKGSNSKTKIEDLVILKGKKSQGTVRLRLVGEKKSEITALSQIRAESSGKGHLDCQGLLTDKAAKISLIPQLICENKEAQLTHEASIGKISEDELIYLRTRGLTEKEAIDLIVSGFLKI